MNIRNLFGKHHESILVLLLFVLLTAAASWPVLLNLDTVIVGKDSDTYINPWADWWTLKAIREPETKLWETDYLFYPTGTGLNYHSFSHLNTAVSLALRPILGALSAYNLTILLNYVLIGLATFQLARYLTGSLTGSILAGTVYAFNSHSLLEAAHPVMVSSWCYPWLTLYLMRMVEEQKMRWAVVAAGIVFLGTTTSTLHFIIMGGWAGSLLLYMAISKSWPALPRQAVLVFIFLSALLTFPLLYPLLSALFLDRNTNFVLGESAFIGSDMFRLFVPSWYAWRMRGLYLGLIPAYLLLLAIGFQRKAARFWLLTLAVTYFLSLGPEPYILGRSLGISLTWVLPVSSLLRNTARLNVIVSLSLAMIVAYGWIAFAGQIKQAKYVRLAGVLFVLLILLDYTGGTFPHLVPRVSPFYTEFLDEVPDEVALAILPIGRQVDKKYLFLQTLHGHRMTGGVISRPRPEVFSFMYDNPLLRAGVNDLERVPLPTDPLPHLEALARANIGYLILEKDLMAVEPWREAIPMEPVYEDEMVLVYATSIE